MKTCLIVCLIIFLVLGGVIAGFYFGYEKLSEKYEGLQKLEFLNDWINETKDKVVTVSTTGKISEKKKKPVAVTVYLTYGGTMEGILLDETETEYVIRYQEQEFVLDKAQVSRVERADSTAAWVHASDVVVKMKTGMKIDAEVKKVKGDKLELEDSSEGNSYSLEVPVDDVEYLLFKPVINQKSTDIGEKLRKEFPDMQFYTEGNITIVTDAYITWVKEYKKHLRVANTQVYLKFLPLFKDREPALHNYVVVFDSYEDFVNHAIDQGIPGWLVMGYFHTEDKVVYLFNVLGDKFSKNLYELFIGATGQMIDAQAEYAKRYYGGDKRAEIVIDGQVDYIKDKIWKVYNRALSDCRNLTLTTLRHEFVHELFSNWGLQNIEVSKSEKRQKLLEKSKDIFTTEDKEAKKQWIEDLLVMGTGAKEYDMKAANSWLVEGLATYCETYPIGKQNDIWLFLFQEMIENDEVYPLEVLTYYKIGSFPGMCNEAVIKAYAQSWAFTTFLLDQYPEELVSYMERAASETVRTDKEELSLFLECMNKDAKEINNEFVAYVNKKYEKLDDPMVKQLLYMHELFKEFM
jgi:hypothetical protein